MSDNAAAMASTSTSDPRNTSKMKSAATTLSGENQTLLADIRKAMVTMKEIGVSLEKQNKTQMVKELETEFVELLKAYEECANLSTAVESVGNMYRPSEQVTDFKKLIDNEMVKTKRRSSAPQVSQLLRQFKEAIWVCLCILFMCVLSNLILTICLTFTHGSRG
ncbi:putative E3 SUMO-protein ligase Nse2 (Mms21) [Helianthus annuus]|nr:putative E3 SUMO-protein ligase Nse2 (Mms21) [Helianthus annuus]